METYFQVIPMHINISRHRPKHLLHFGLVSARDPNNPVCASASTQTNFNIHCVTSALSCLSRESVTSRTMRNPIRAPTGMGVNDARIEPIGAARYAKLQDLVTGLVVQ